MIEVSIEFPLQQDFEEVSDKLTELAAQYNGECCSSGAGCGKRDMQFVFKNKNLAILFKNSVIQLGIMVS
jgi:hypothetical protein